MQGPGRRRSKPPDPDGVLAKVQALRQRAWGPILLFVLAVLLLIGALALLMGTPSADYHPRTAR